MAESGNVASDDVRGALRRSVAGRARHVVMWMHLLIACARARAYNTAAPTPSAQRPAMQATGSRNDVVGIVGAGLMGRGIAQITAQAGFEVRLVDAKPGAAADAKRAIADVLATLAAKGRIAAARRRCRGRAHRAARDARRTRRLFDRDRGDRRTTRCEAGTVPGAWKRSLAISASWQPTRRHFRSPQSRAHARIPSASLDCISSAPCR